jgi:hypothetical protein
VRQNLVHRQRLRGIWQRFQWFGHNNIFRRHGTTIWIFGREKLEPSQLGEMAAIAMSAIGPKRTFQSQRPRSTMGHSGHALVHCTVRFGSKADMTYCGANVRLWPTPRKQLILQAQGFPVFQCFTILFAGRS